MKTIRLREGKERSFQRQHPWVFQGSVEKGRADAGETVRVESHSGEFLAWAAFSPSEVGLRLVFEQRGESVSFNHKLEVLNVP